MDSTLPIKTKEACLRSGRNLKKFFNSNISFQKLWEIIEDLTKIEFDIYTEELIKIVFKRGNLDFKNGYILEKINFNKLSKDNIKSVEEMFYLHPLNFVKFKIHEKGLEIDREMTIELLKELNDIFDEELFNNITFAITKKIKYFNLNEIMIDLLYSNDNIKTSVENSDGTTKIDLGKNNKNRKTAKNYNFKHFILKNITFENISTSSFVKFCLYLIKEEDLKLIEFSLKKLIYMRKNINEVLVRKYFSLIEKWKQNINLNILIRRIYPLRYGKFTETDLNYYENLLNSCNDENEVVLLRSIYKSIIYK